MVQNSFIGDLMMKQITLVAVLSSLLFTVSSTAQEVEDDGAVSPPPHMKHHKKHKKHHAKMIKRRLQKIDSNDDGQIDLSEYLANAEQRFHSMDADSNGLVTAQEMREWGKSIRKKHREARKEAKKAYQEEIQQ